MTLHNKRFFFLLIGVLILGFSLRIWNINHVPAGIYPDEAQNGIDAVIANTSSNHLWFYPDNNGREGLYINLIAGSFALFGISILSFKLVSIIIGTLTILGTYLLMQEIVYDQRYGHWIALVTAFFVSVSFWHINFSRIGFRAILLPLVLVFSFWLLLRAFRLLQTPDNPITTDNFPKLQQPLLLFFISGIIFGLGLHTYIAFRIAPLIVIIFVGALVIMRKFTISQLLIPALLFMFGAVISAGPLLYTFTQHPDYLSGRSSVSIFDTANNHGHFAQTLTKTISLSLMQFNFWGDQNWRHGYPPYPILEPLVGILFIVGLLTSVWMIFRALLMLLPPLQHSHLTTKTTAQNNIPLSIHYFLLTWFVAMLAPEFLTTEGLPHSLRAIGVLPVVYIFAGIGFAQIVSVASQQQLFFRHAFVPFTGIILLYIGMFGTLKYHVYWAHESQMAGAFNANLTAIAQRTTQLPDTIRKIVLAGSLERLPIKLLNTKTKNLTIIYEHEIVQLSNTHIPTIIFVTDNYPRIVDAFTKRFGLLAIHRHSPNLGTTYYTLTPQQ